MSGSAAHVLLAAGLSVTVFVSGVLLLILVVVTATGVTLRPSTPPVNLDVAC